MRMARQRPDAVFYRRTVLSPEALAREMQLGAVWYMDVLNYPRTCLR